MLMCRVFLLSALKTVLLLNVFMETKNKKKLIKNIETERNSITVFNVTFD